LHIVCAAELAQHASGRREAKEITMDANKKIETATEAIAFLQTKHLAIRFNLKPQQLRRVLRSMPAYADGVHTKYRWDPKDEKAIKAIELRIVEIKKAKEEAAKKAKEALAAKQAAQKEQEKLDKKAA
jgi:hypothetical protein